MFISVYILCSGRYRSICSTIKCTLIYLFLKASNGAVYNAMQAAYIGLRIMGYFCVTRLPSTIILSAIFLYVLFMRLFVQAYKLKYTVLEI